MLGFLETRGRESREGRGMYRGRRREHFAAGIESDARGSWMRGVEFTTVERGKRV